MGSALARQIGQDESEAIRHFAQRLAVLLAKGNSALLLNRIPTYPSPDIDGQDWTLYFTYDIFHKYLWFICLGAAYELSLALIRTIISEKENSSPVPPNLLHLDVPRYYEFYNSYIKEGIIIKNQ